MFLLTSIREELVRAGSTTDSHAAPRLVIVLEEAHNLVPAVPEDATPSEEGSAKIESSRYISNMLAEMRALGLAIIVVDQTPSAVSAQVIRSTNLKIAHRSVAKADRETLADSMLMQRMGWDQITPERIDALLQTIGQAIRAQLLHYPSPPASA